MALGGMRQKWLLLALVFDNNSIEFEFCDKISNSWVKKQLPGLSVIAVEEKYNAYRLWALRMPGSRKEIHKMPSKQSNSSLSSHSFLYGGMAYEDCAAQQEYNYM